MNALSHGYTGDTGAAVVNGLLNRGGTNSMIGTVGIVIGAAAFGAPLKASGATDTLVLSVQKLAKTPKQLMLLTWLLHPIFMIISAAYYVSYPVIGGILSPVYDGYNIKRTELSRIMGSTGIAIASLVPWVPAGAFVIGQLGLGVEEFLPYAFFNLITPLLCLLMISVGFDKFTLKKKRDKAFSKSQLEVTK